MGLILDAQVTPRHHTQQPLAQGISSSAHHRDISSFSFRSRDRFQRDRLKDVFRHTSAVVLRAKGVVWLSGAEKAHELHVVGSRIMLTSFAGATPDESKIVLIGRFSDEDEQRLMLELENAHD
jgi:G3E family GTPase